MRRDTTIEDTLRSIENRVMGDVWLGATRRHGGRMLAIALGFTAVAVIVSLIWLPETRGRDLDSIQT